ncbi:MAG: transglycosylase SLT domain-containing protein, partial [Pseudomonadota bacterium]|nr:transglycosylase SLT domain-containing protein [Pseudomonadota bacterium]
STGIVNTNTAPTTRSGLEIHQRFRAHLAEPDCSNADPRWKQHYARAPHRMASHDDELMAVFGYVIDEFIKAGLPTEYALVPFIESRYNPSAKSNAGPAGLWQFIALTARNQGVVMRDGYDGRYSVVESTRAAVRYFKILHSMFGSNWRVAVMGYNAGEYRVIGAIKRSGQNQRDADAARIAGVPAITRAYVEKLHAISCLIEEAEDRQGWLQALDRPIPILNAERLDAEYPSLNHLAEARALDPKLLARLNPGLSSGRLRSGANAPKVLLPAQSGANTPGMASTAASQRPAAAGSGPASSSTIAAGAVDGHTAQPGERGKRYTVQAGDSLWRVARRHGLSIAQLMRLNQLKPGSTLRPGMVLKLDEGPP